MRIAVSGAHTTGKTSLVAALGSAWPGHTIIDEAYYELLAIGTNFGLELSALDFEAQLAHSLRVMASADGPHSIFDRCPIDYLAYLRAPDNSADLADLLPPVRDAVETLDLLIYVPLESPDRIGISADEHPRLRKTVDRLLRSALLEDAWGLGVAALEVTGTISERAAQVQAHCRSR